MDVGPHGAGHDPERTRADPERTCADPERTRADPARAGLDPVRRADLVRRGPFRDGPGGSRTPLALLVLESYGVPLPPGWCVLPRNGDALDLRGSNLALVDPECPARALGPVSSLGAPRPPRPIWAKTPGGVFREPPAGLAGRP